MAKQRDKKDPAEEARQAAWQFIRQQPLLAPLAERIYAVNVDKHYDHVARGGWLSISPHGYLWLSPKRAESQVWIRLMAQALVCLGFGLVQKKEPQDVWELAALLVSHRFCNDLKIGQLPEDLLFDFPPVPNGGMDALFRSLIVGGYDDRLQQWYLDFIGRPVEKRGYFCSLEEPSPYWDKRITDWKALFALGISRGVEDALMTTVEPSRRDGHRSQRHSPAQRAKARVIDRYPLLGALAASFDIEENPALCQQYDIQVAAIDVGARKIWMNPVAALKEEEYVFVFAHELLHAGLNHTSRCRGRDPLLWNIACDFVINAWLIEMQVGTAPALGLLYDEKFNDYSAEEVYDSLAQDIRRARKLATLRGAGRGDLIGEYEAARQGSLFTDAEAYCRRALAMGLDRCMMQGGRGTIPAGLMEEIRSLMQPPIPWDVRLAEWFDEHFPALEWRRSYARPSRRQASTPDIPRPSVIRPPEELRRSRVFGVVLDTSGSMDIKLLGKALGAIASYALAHEVYAVRLVCCDAAAYDMGWVQPEQLLDRFTLRGRGGTVLQPGIHLLRDLAHKAAFPVQGPILIITDGDCEDHLSVTMEHAYLLPEGRRLPFVPRGQVFAVA